MNRKKLLIGVVVGSLLLPNSNVVYGMEAANTPKNSNVDLQKGQVDKVINSNNVNVSNSPLEQAIQNKKVELQQTQLDMDKVKKEIENIGNQLKGLQEEKYYIENRLNLINEKIAEKKEELVKANLELAKLRNEMYKIQKEKKEREDLFRDRLNSMYKDNYKGNLLEVIFNSDGLGDLITKLFAYKKIVDADNKVIEEYMSLVEELEEKEKVTNDLVKRIDENMDELKKMYKESNDVLQEKKQVEKKLEETRKKLQEQEKVLQDKYVNLKVDLANLVNSKIIEEKKAKEIKDIDKEQIMKLIEEKAAKYHLPVELIQAVVQKESGFDPTAINVNDDGSVDRGLMQINSGTAPGLAAKLGIKYKEGIEFIPEIAIEMGAYYLSQYYVPDNLHYTLTVYNKGPGGAKRWLEKYGTYVSDYSSKVIEYMNIFKQTNTK